MRQTATFARDKKAFRSISGDFPEALIFGSFHQGKGLEIGGKKFSTHDGPLNITFYIAEAMNRAGI